LEEETLWRKTLSRPSLAPLVYLRKTQRSPSGVKRVVISTIMTGVFPLAARLKPVLRQTGPVIC
jgi:hypothetical protein